MSKFETMKYVDPNIGTVSVLLAPCTPLVQLPHGMVRIAPIRLQEHNDPWLSDYITGFPFNIISHRGRAAFSLMVCSNGCDGDVIKAEADHDMETVKPYRTDLLLEKPEIDVSFTVTEQAMIYRFEFRKPDTYDFVFSANDGTVETKTDERIISGCEYIEGVHCYFYAKIDTPFATNEPAPGTTPNSELRTTHSGAASHDPTTLKTPNSCLNFTANNKTITVKTKKPNQAVEIKVGFSYIGKEQAKINLQAQVGDKSFAQVAKAGKEAWENALSKIEVTGGTKKQRRIFYTSFWRCFERQVSITEKDADGNNLYYSAYDKRVHEGEKTPFYVDDWIWDTYRGLHPLRIIIDPEREQHILNSYTRMIKQGDGWALFFPLVTGSRAAMLGNNLAAVVLDACNKGLKGFDIEVLYSALRKTATEGSRIPWHIGPATELDEFYLSNGYFPALKYGEKEWIKEVHDLERRQSVSVTLEHSYSDWCISQLSEALGEKDDAAIFGARAKNYQNLYHSGHGVFAPRGKDGEWIEPFDPGLSGGIGGRDYYAECNGWVWLWHVPHDIEGLIKLMGGKKEFVKNLDELFNKPLGVWKPGFFDQFPDSTGLIGQFPMGNEPGFLIPYLYLYAGAAWRTQKRVRQIMDIWFDDTPCGVCGDEDGGALSAWYVFSAIGFYPLCPGQPIYGIGSPIFEKSVISLGKGGKFTIIAENVSKRNKYVQSATLNGKLINRAWFNHSELVDGGSLVLKMGSMPNKKWGCEWA